MRTAGSTQSCEDSALSPERLGDKNKPPTYSPLHGRCSRRNRPALQKALPARLYFQYPIQLQHCFDGYECIGRAIQQRRCTGLVCHVYVYKIVGVLLSRAYSWEHTIERGLCAESAPLGGKKQNPNVHHPSWSWQPPQPAGPLGSAASPPLL